jgi:hypothetical protein
MCTGTASSVKVLDSKSFVSLLNESDQSAKTIYWTAKWCG